MAVAAAMRGLSIRANDGHAPLFSWACSLRHLGRAIRVGPPADDSRLHGLGDGNDFGRNERPAGFDLLPVLLFIGAGSVILWWHTRRPKG
jgi:hypothetical protein